MSISTKVPKKNSALIKTLLVVCCIGLLTAIVWQYFIMQDKTGTDVIQSAEPTTEQHPDKTLRDSPTETIDTSIHEVDITLANEADLLKLPDYTPASFRQYLSEKLRNNHPVKRDNVTVTPTWIVNKISQVAIQGGQAPVATDGTVYPGGAPILWVLTPAGTWDEVGLNDPLCTSTHGGKIYEEFVPTCYDEAHPDSYKNPNGSIKALAN